MPSKRKTPTNRMPELLVAGLIFAGGAWFWSQQLAPKPDPAPEIRMPGPPGGPKQEFALQPSWVPADLKIKPPTAAERQSAQKVIVAQLNAFKANKWPLAISYQSQNLKRNFPSPQQFRQMMVKSYPQFTAYKSITFGAAHSDGTHLQILARLVGQDGIHVSAVYVMIKEKGNYRIDGVSGGTAPPPPKGTMV